MGDGLTRVDRINYYG